MDIYRLALKNVSRPHSAVPTNCVSLFFFFLRTEKLGVRDSVTSLRHYLILPWAVGQ